MMEPNKNLDKAGLEHWAQTERNTDVALEAFKPLPGVRGFGRRQWHAMLHDCLLGPNSRAQRELLELGCGGSAYLPYFATELGFEVSGIDYAQQGLELARRMCQAHGVASPHLYCVDIFNAPAECLGRYDAVVSFGVVEHFTDTDATVAAFAKFLRPGGVILSVVPNMQGLTGWGQKMVARDVYNVHEVIDVHRLRTAHERAGLSVKRCEYFMFNNFGVINPGLNVGAVKRAAFQALRAATGAAWAVESHLGAFSSNAVTSPYVICAARKAG